MKICVAGAYGAFGLKHLDALKNIEDIEVTSIMGPNKAKIELLAEERNIPNARTTLEESISEDNPDAIILATPTQAHAEQAIACMNAGKHVADTSPETQPLRRLRRIESSRSVGGSSSRTIASPESRSNVIPRAPRARSCSSNQAQFEM